MDTSARRALPRLLMLYAAASLFHFAHNAEYLAQYPNLPSSWSRSDIYIAWCCITTLGVVGYLLYLHGNRAVGLTFLASYAVLGFGGFLAFMHLLGYPKRLRYLNLLLEWITRESSTSVVAGFFAATTSDCSVRPFDSFRMRRRWQFLCDCNAHAGRSIGSVRRCPSAGELPKGAAEHIGHPHQ